MSDLPPNTISIIFSTPSPNVADAIMDGIRTHYPDAKIVAGGVVGKDASVMVELSSEGQQENRRATDRRTTDRRAADRRIADRRAMDRRVQVV
jgi:hypothetical protein